MELLLVVLQLLLKKFKIILFTKNPTKYLVVKVIVSYKT